MSKYLTIDTQDLKKAGIKLGLVLLGALATFLEQDFLNIVDFGQFAFLAVAVNTFIIDLIRKFVTDEEGKLLGRYQL